MLPIRIWSFYVKGSGHNYGDPQIWGAGAHPFGGGVSDPLHIRLFPTWVINPNLIAVGQTVRAYGHPPAKMGPRRLAFQDHTMSSIGTDMDRSDTYDLLILILVTMGPVLCRFRDIARYWPKIPNFPERTLIYRRFPLELYNGA